VFERPDWAADASLATNNARIDAADRLLPAVEAHFKTYTKQEIIERCEAARLPFAPIAQPEELFNDPQLNLVPTTLPDGTTTTLPRVPLEMGAYDFGLRHHPPQIGSATDALLAELGYSVSDIQQLKDAGKLA
jgi:crotonobetainyl-CoA:carnitine CoA-transferase CaiB-like acyl-CoA transferase